MRDKNYYIALDDSERRLIISCLNDFRNNLISEGRYTDGVDDVLIKLINAPIKKFKVISREE